ncbi:MAG: glycine cleavage system aminomethyltransferase GcvT [Chloroflexi bacterium]|nr:glycine cleavage system aminomethyltransferase GcvT [Chloroflexota bacterium]
MSAELLRTPLAAEHEALGARMVDFAGWYMPVQYEGVIAEHLAVRTSVGLFDVSHMGEFVVRGAGALEFLQQVTTNDVSRLAIGQAQYSLLCLPSGGVVDDVIVYRFVDHFLVVVNAANIGKDFAWLGEYRSPDVMLEDRSADTALLALQGPRAEQALQSLTPAPLRELRRFRAVDAPVAGVAATIARTGYTGEDGFEIFCRSGDAAALWRRLLDASPTPEPCGLGARDTLRLEAALPLYGHEMNEQTTPLVAGLERFVRLDKGPFLARERLLAQQARGPARRLAGLELVDRGVPRAECVVVRDGAIVGRVTSGTYAPYLQRGIALAYVAPALAEPGHDLGVVVRERALRARTVPVPFYRRAA